MIESLYILREQTEVHLPVPGPTPATYRGGYDHDATVPLVGAAAPFAFLCFGEVEKPPRAVREHDARASATGHTWGEPATGIGGQGVVVESRRLARR